MLKPLNRWQYPPERPEVFTAGKRKPVSASGRARSERGQRINVSEAAPGSQVSVSERRVRMALPVQPHCLDTGFARRELEELLCFRIVCRAHVCDGQAESLIKQGGAQVVPRCLGSGFPGSQRFVSHRNTGMSQDWAIRN